MIFLQEVAKEISKSKDDFQNLNIICPNIRTIDYLKHYIAGELNQTTWSPKFMNLSELFQKYTDFKKADELVLMLELFKAFKLVFAESKYFSDYNFDKFYGIGEIILKDFNEIDNYLIDIDKIFINIYDYENINYAKDYLTEEQIATIQEFFSHFSTENISEEKEYFIELWTKIPSLYKLFNEKLLARNIGYNGLINRDLANRIKATGFQSENENERYIFVGFNALTKAQKVVMQEIQKTGKAKFFWDYDNFYVNDWENEAGLFVRENLKIFSDDLKIDRNTLKNDKNIRLIGFPLEISQTKAIPTILKEMNIDLTDKKQLAKTAIVMPDDNMLFQVLHALPQQIEQVNVTLGFPFKNTRIYNFISQWLDLLYIFIKKTNVYYDDLTHFFDNQLLSEIFENNLEYVQNFFSKQKAMYYKIEDLQAIDNHYVNILFDKQNISNVDVLLENILKILEVIFYKIDKLQRQVETEAIFQFYKQMLSIQTLFANELANDKEIISSQIIIRFLKNQLSGVHIPFQGKSLDGLQLMTIMETRNLDFENLIILNLNEQILPQKANNSSLISEFMRQSFGMPILMYQDSIFAFLFYSLIQNSKNIVLTYSNLISDKSGELSRFVQQLKYETNLIKQTEQFGEQINPKRMQKFEVEKTDEIYAKLENYLFGQKLLSASSLNTYISCPLKFYFQKIEKIEPIEQDKNEFEIDALKFGNIFHNSMEKLYTPYIGRIITKEDFKIIRKKIDATIQETLLDELQNIKEATENGLNEIITDVIKKYVKRLLEIDENYAPFRVLSLETSKIYKGIFDINVNSKSHKINILAILDRVDEKDKITRIIDYKTGKDDLQIKKVEMLFNTEKITNKKKAIFQMLLYSLIYKQNMPTFYFEPMLLKTTEMLTNSSGKIKIDKEEINSESSEILNEFEGYLIELLEEIFDKEISFSQTPNIETCKYCDFVGICGI